MLKTIPPIYCGDNKCTQKESDPKSFTYCRKDCLGVKSIVSDLETHVKPINRYLTKSFVSIKRKNGQFSSDPLTYSGEVKYLTFDKAGNYNISYNLYYVDSLKAKKLIGSTSCNINVVDKPTAGKYMRMFLTYEAPAKAKADCPTNFYLLDPKTKELKYITAESGRFKNVAPTSSIYAYRDLDGRFVSFD